MCPDLCVRELCKVLYHLSLSSKVASTNRTKNTRGSNIVTSDFHKLLYAQVIVHYTNNVSTIKITSSCFQHTIKRWLKQFNLECSDFLLENTTSCVLQLLNFKSSLLTSRTNTHSFTRSASILFHTHLDLIEVLLSCNHPLDVTSQFSNTTVLINMNLFTRAIIKLFNLTSNN